MLILVSCFNISAQYSHACLVKLVEILIVTYYVFFMSSLEPNENIC